MFSHSILHEKCTEIVYELRRLGIPTFFEAEEHVYYDSRCMSPELGNSVSNFKSLNCSVPDMPERPEDSDVVFDKFFCLLRPDDPVDKLRSFIGDEFTAVPQGEHYLEIVPTGCSKAEGIHILQKKLGIPKDNCYAIGDSENDIPMLEVSAVPFAPANAIPAVHEFGAHIVSHCSDGAVADVVEYLDKIY